MIWTDFGGVLTPPVQHTVKRFCRLVGVEPAALLRAMRVVGDEFGVDPMAVLDTPLITEEQWGRRVEAAVRADSGESVDLSGFADKWFADRETNRTWLAELRRAKEAGAGLGLLSNMPPSWDAHWRRMVPPDNLFDHVVLSFEAGHRKPDREIFALASARAGVPPEHCVLVDDLAENCAGAEQAGWQAIPFTENPPAIAELRHWLAGPASR